MKKVVVYMIYRKKNIQNKPKTKTKKTQKIERKKIQKKPKIFMKVE